MALPPEADRQIVGPLGVVEFAVASNDKMAEGWKWWNKLDKRGQAMLKALMTRLVENGDIQSETGFKQLDGPIWEFKRASFRMLCYRVDQRCLLTNGLSKGGRKNIEQDIKKAKRIGEGHLQWEISQRSGSGQ